MVGVLDLAQLGDHMIAGGQVVGILRQPGLRLREPGLCVGQLVLRVLQLLPTRGRAGFAGDRDEVEPISPVRAGLRLGGQRLDPLLRFASGGCGGRGHAPQATLRETLADPGDDGGIAEPAEVADGALELGADRQHAQAVLVQELEGRVLAAELGP